MLPKCQLDGPSAAATHLKVEGQQYQTSSIDDRQGFAFIF